MILMSMMLMMKGLSFIHNMRRSSSFVTDRDLHCDRMNDWLTRVTVLRLRLLFLLSVCVRAVAAVVVGKIFRLPLYHFTSALVYVFLCNFATAVAVLWALTIDTTTVTNTNTNTHMDSFVLSWLHFLPQPTKTPFFSHSLLVSSVTVQHRSFVTTISAAYFYSLPYCVARLDNQPLLWTLSSCSFNAALIIPIFFFPFLLFSTPYSSIVDMFFFAHLTTIITIPYWYFIMRHVFFLQAPVFLCILFRTSHLILHGSILFLAHFFLICFRFVFLFFRVCFHRLFAMFFISLSSLVIPFTLPTCFIYVAFLPPFCFSLVDLEPTTSPYLVADWVHLFVTPACLFRFFINHPYFYFLCLVFIQFSFLSHSCLLGWHLFCFVLLSFLHELFSSSSWASSSSTQSSFTLLLLFVYDFILARFSFAPLLFLSLPFAILAVTTISPFSLYPQFRFPSFPPILVTIVTHFPCFSLSLLLHLTCLSVMNIPTSHSHVLPLI